MAFPFPNLVELALLTAGAAVLVLVLILVARGLYNIFLHPLHDFPGPWYAQASVLWDTYHLLRGDHFLWLQSLHRKYGPVVRYAPNELGFLEPEAWKDIYGHRPGMPEFAKAKHNVFARNSVAHPNIILADQEHHALLRRLLSHGFSDKAIREYEHVLCGYVVKLVERLREKEDVGEEVDMVRWMNFTTFDILGHLTFTESFESLSSPDPDYHLWIETALSLPKFIVYTRAASRISPSLVPLVQRLFPRSLLHKAAQSFQLAREKVARRRQCQPHYTDFLTNWVAAQEKGVLAVEDLYENAPVLVMAGSEAAATLLAFAVHSLLRDRRVYDLVVAEVRGAFARCIEDITVAKVGECAYLTAVLSEVLRLYPPTSSAHPREVPAGGATVAGRFVPGGFLVGVPKWACFRSAQNFTDPDDFVPERWLGTDPAGRYAADRLDAVQPFHVGPRNCIGKNLAYIEMRLIMAHLLVEFDMEPGSEVDVEGWDKQKFFGMWMKKPLMVRLRRLRRPSNS